MITDPRFVYKPFEYIFAQEYKKKQQLAHWLPDELTFGQDMMDFKNSLTDGERELVGGILKSFAQTETVVEDYWSTKVVKWFPKPEIRGMAITFAAMEDVHAEAYSLLNETLGLDNFSAFLEDPTAMAKLEMLQKVTDDDFEEIAISLAIFSAFTEGVNLFSSFAILMSFQMRNMLKTVGQIVEWSVRDESLHSEAGCHLYRQLIKEHPYLLTDKLRKSINDACEICVTLEIDFIKNVFQKIDNDIVLGTDTTTNIPWILSEKHMINFIKHRANTKMSDLELPPVYKDINKMQLQEMDWFDSLTSGRSHTDFFNSRVTDYSKSTHDWEDDLLGS